MWDFGSENTYLIVWVATWRFVEPEHWTFGWHPMHTYMHIAKCNMQYLEMTKYFLLHVESCLHAIRVLQLSVHCTINWSTLVTQNFRPFDEQRFHYQADGLHIICTYYVHLNSVDGVWWGFAENLKWGALGAVRVNIAHSSFFSLFNLRAESPASKWPSALSVARGKEEKGGVEGTLTNYSTLVWNSNCIVSLFCFYCLFAFV